MLPSLSHDGGTASLFFQQLDAVRAVSLKNIFSSTLFLSVKKEPVSGSLQYYGNDVILTHA